METRNIYQQLSYLSNEQLSHQTIIRDLEKHVLHVQSSKIDDITIELSILEKHVLHVQRSKIDDITIELSILKLQFDKLENRMRKLEKNAFKKYPTWREGH
jgi:ubiquinone biosynthesis protein UbiJ